jgi:hypothetical protein
MVLGQDSGITSLRVRTEPERVQLVPAGRSDHSMPLDSGALPPPDRVSVAQETAAVSGNAPVPGTGRGRLPAALAPGPVHQLEDRSDPAGRLPAAMPSIITAADQLRRSAWPPDTRRQASDLLLTLAAVECHASVSGPALVPPALLRDLVIITARLAGRAWLETNADNAAAFTALQATWQPPPLPELDQILARVLSDRFRLPSPTAAA